MVGKGNPETARMAIYVDQPSFLDDRQKKPFSSESGDLLHHFMSRMGIHSDWYYLDYILKCACPKKMMPKQKAERLQCIEACSKYRFATLQTMPDLKVIVAMGKIALEAFTGNTEIGKFEGCGWEPREPEIRSLGVQKIWVTYSPLYLLEKPAETPDIYGVLWCAAEEAGLKPQETKVPPYKWNV
jgi:uracil-DNA glycosylase family 4